MSDQPTGPTELDVLSQTAATILHDGPPGRYQELVVSGKTSDIARERLGKIRPQELLEEPPEDPEDAKAMLAGFWLWFDALAESHAISQDLVSASGSFWHAILHRREGDFSNAKYWYQRCRTHRANRILGAVSGNIAGDFRSDPLINHITAEEWDGAAFTDLVAELHGKPNDPRRPVAIKLQQAEWQALFNHCALGAAGSPLD